MQGGGAIIEDVKNNQKPCVSKLFEWIEIERKKALLDARTVFPDDYKLYGILSIWFDQVKEKVEANLPEHYVRRVIVFENMEDGVTSVEYDYYPEEVTSIKEIAFIQRKRIKG